MYFSESCNAVCCNGNESHSVGRKVRKAKIMGLINLFCMVRIHPGVYLACDYLASKVMLPSFPHSRQPRRAHPEFLGNAVQPKGRKPSENRDEYDTNDGPYLEPIRGVAGMHTSVARNIGGQNRSVNCNSRMPHSHTTLAPFDRLCEILMNMSGLRHRGCAPTPARHHCAVPPTPLGEGLQSLVRRPLARLPVSMLCAAYNSYT